MTRGNEAVVISSAADVSRSRLFMPRIVALAQPDARIAMGKMTGFVGSASADVRGKTIR
jgi:hypothetical protein